MATREQRDRALALIKEGDRLAEERAEKLNEASDLLGSPKFRQHLHDLRTHSQKLEAYARADIYHADQPKGDAQ